MADGLMAITFDPVLLSRLQFGFTIAFHILFPAFTIGLASWLAVVAGLWLATGDPLWGRLYRLWVKVFAVSFAMGVVSGIVISYEFGTNWSRLSAAAGPVLGPLMSYEVLTAFFLEASFLGVMLFGLDRVPRWVHLGATVMVALGTLLSAFWILAANSWMQTPAGAEWRDGVFYPVDWIAIVFNPSFPVRLVHTVLASYLTTCFVIGGVAAWYLRHGRHQPEARVMLVMAVPFAAVVGTAQIFVGDEHGLNVRDHQPVKLAAIEAIWDGGPSQPLLLFALPDGRAETNHFAVGIPFLASLILTRSWTGTLPGLKAVAPEDRPPVAVVFWSFRLMVLIGVAMAGLGWGGLVLLGRGRLFQSRRFLALWTAMIPSGFAAVLLGWITAEVGRQPWVVYGSLRTADAVSPIPGTSVAISFALFMLVYLVIFGAGGRIILALIRRGPIALAAPDTGRGARPLAAATERDQGSAS